MAVNKKMQTWLPVLLGAMMAVGMWGGYQLYRHMAWRQVGAPAGSSGSTRQVLDLIQYKYVDTLALDTLEVNAIQAIMQNLDPHSVFIAPSVMSDVAAELEGNFSGIGVEYQMVRDTVVVVYVFDKGPAAAAGLETGDAILKVEDQNIAGTGVKNGELRSLLRGKANSTVKIQFLRNGNTSETTITRGQIPMPSVDAWYLAASDVGYIKLNRFAETSYFEFMDAANALLKQGMKKMILDLRGNGGGLLEQATHITDELLEDGLKIVTTRGAHVKEETITATKPGLFEKGALVILLDGQSASASEVIAGALQDHDRATIIGARSFGKGLVQEQFTLANGGALRLTTARYFTPLGRGIQKPYDSGYAAYQHELWDRPMNGSYARQTDTLNRKTFTTRKGKKLFEAGGISPDIQIGPDTMKYSAALKKLAASSALADISLQAFLAEKNTIATFRSAPAFYDNFQVTEPYWKQLETMALKDSVPWKALTAGDKVWLEARIKATMARYKWRSTGYMQVINRTDPVMKAALSFLQQAAP